MRKRVMWRPLVLFTASATVVGLGIYHVNDRWRHPLASEAPAAGSLPLSKAPSPERDASTAQSLPAETPATPAVQLLKPGQADYARYQRSYGCMQAKLQGAADERIRCEGLLAADMSSAYVYLQRAALAGYPAAAVPYALAGPHGEHLYVPLDQVRVDESDPNWRQFFESTRPLIRAAAEAGDRMAIASMVGYHSPGGHQPNAEENTRWYARLREARP